ncbi:MULTISPECIES: hypothetical protein [unclassified Mameliella]|uniref:hypothetical protein n=1 Tax=unclassified Mameliella TaxID=2630630 RepID=UPI00273DC680|nr:MULTISPECIES: hypothetical protein [unclassified Mameliella]
MSDDLKERLRMMPTYSGDPKGPHWVPNLAADRIEALEAQLADALAQARADGMREAATVAQAYAMQAGASGAFVAGEIREHILAAIEKGEG